MQPAQLVAVRIKDGLFVGNQTSSLDDEFLFMNKVTHIINCAGSETQNLYQQANIHYLTFHWRDLPGTILLDPEGRNVKQIFEFVEKGLEKGECVLVHSVLGISRCCAAVAAYLMKKYGWTLDNTIAFMRTAHPDMDIKPYFIRQLGILSRKLEQQYDIFHPEIDTDTFALDNEQWVLRNTYFNALGFDHVLNAETRRHIMSYEERNSRNQQNAPVKPRITFSDTGQGTTVTSGVSKPIIGGKTGVDPDLKLLPATRGILAKAPVQLIHSLQSPDGMQCTIEKWPLKSHRGTSAASTSSLGSAPLSSKRVDSTPATAPAQLLGNYTSFQSSRFDSVSGQGAASAPAAGGYQGFSTSQVHQIPSNPSSSISQQQGQPSLAFFNRTDSPVLRPQEPPAASQVRQQPSQQTYQPQGVGVGANGGWSLSSRLAGSQQPPGQASALGPHQSHQSHQPQQQQQQHQQQYHLPQHDHQANGGSGSGLLGADQQSSLLSVSQQLMSQVNVPRRELPSKKSDPPTSSLQTQRRTSTGSERGRQGAGSPFMVHAGPRKGSPLPQRLDKPRSAASQHHYDPQAAQPGAFSDSMGPNAGGALSRIQAQHGIRTGTPPKSRTGSPVGRQAMTGSPQRPGGLGGRKTYSSLHSQGGGSRTNSPMQRRGTPTRDRPGTPTRDKMPDYSNVAGKVDTGLGRMGRPQLSRADALQQQQQSAMWDEYGSAFTAREDTYNSQPESVRTFEDDRRKRPVKKRTSTLPPSNTTPSSLQHSLRKPLRTSSASDRLMQPTASFLRKTSRVS